VTFTDEQLWAAVRSAGRDGQSFTCATVREVLGMSSNKRHELAQFRDRFRAFRLTAGEGIAKVGKSAYRLTASEEQEVSEALIEIEVIAIADDAEEGAELSAPEVAATEVVAASTPEVIEVQASTPEPTEDAPTLPYHPIAIEETDLGFGEPMVASAADSGELAANHVIFSAWPEDAAAAESGDGTAPTTEPQADSRLASQQTEASIEAEVRELVTAPEDSRRNGAESLIAQAEHAVMRTWRDRGHWLGRRFAELFSRTQN
jgi:hypothetical protein